MTPEEAEKARRDHEWGIEETDDPLELTNRDRMEMDEAQRAGRQQRGKDPLGIAGWEKSEDDEEDTDYWRGAARQFEG